MIKKFSAIIVLLILALPSVLAFERVQVRDTNVFLDTTVNETLITNFLEQFDLSRINAIYFLNKEYRLAGQFSSFGYWGQIFIYDMQAEDRFWQGTFCLEYGHSVGWNTYRDMSEDFATDYCTVK